MTANKPTKRDKVRAKQVDRGRAAATPSEIPGKGWRDIMWRIWAEIGEDRISLTAAGTSFFLLLALFPGIAAFVSLYGFVSKPVTIADHISFLGGLLPRGGLDLIKSQLDSLVKQNGAALSFGFIFGLLATLWSANNGIKTLFEAMNVVYDESEKRAFIKLNLVSLAFTLGAILTGVVLLLGMGVVPVVLAVVGLDRQAALIISILRWPILLAFIATGMSLIYRYGPSRNTAKWRWITWGSALATVMWVIASLGFSYYLEHFADYNATYGSLGAVIGFLIWTYISIYILLVGAEINAEIEHQTAVDSTTGPPRPMGQRGATMADTVGKTADAPRDARTRTPQLNKPKTS